MRTTIRYAGLDEGMMTRLKLAASLLSAHRIEPTVEPWDGTRCSLLVANGDDAYGLASIESASRRGVRTLNLTRESNGTSSGQGQNTTVPTYCPLLRLAEELRNHLTNGDSNATASGPQEFAPTGEQGEDMTSPNGLIARLASEFRGQDIVAEHQQRRAVIMATRGRIYFPSVEQREHFRTEAGAATWTIRALSQERGSLDLPVSGSLESELVFAAIHPKTKLPAFPMAAGKLLHWPDLGSASGRTDALSLASLLLGASYDVASAAGALGMSMEATNAYFWAFRAAGLLETGNQATAGEPEMSNAVRAKSGSRRGLLGRIAAKFGLGFRGHG